MVRERKFTQDELYQATPNLMLEVGYEKFSFMLLSKQLHISRAALYKYYGNKDELVQEYLNDQMEQMVKTIESIEWSTDFKEKLSQLINLIFKYADTHTISNMIPTQNWTKENNDLPNVHRAKHLHSVLFSFIQKVIEEGQNQGYLLTDIPPMFIIEHLFHSITLPNRAGLSATARATYLNYSHLCGHLEVGDSWEQSRLNSGCLYCQRLLLWTKLSPQHLRFCFFIRVVKFSIPLAE